jgi:predicted metal-dependent phosphoesterase TrpH/glycosyltransferase involved in cell wall biosynthesis
VKAHLHIALVTAFSWSTPSAVNQQVADLARGLKAQGHMPVVVASSDDLREAVRMRSLFQRTRGLVVGLLGEYSSGAAPNALLLPPPGVGPLNPEDGIPVVPVGYSFPVRLNGGVANLGLPVDVTSRLEKLILGADFDLVHVHEPLAPSLSFSALREARSPVVGTFHLTPVGVAAYELGQSVLDRFFERLDARIVTFSHGLQMMEELYPGAYEVVPCATGIIGRPGGSELLRASELLGAPEWQGAPDLPSQALSGARPPGSPPTGRFGLYVYRGDGRRSYRALLRALLADFPADLERVVVALHRPSTERWLPRAAPRKLKSRVALYEFDAPGELEPLYRSAAVAILPYLGGEWLGITAAEAVVCGCPLVGPDLPPLWDHISGGAGQGAVFSPSESGSLGAAIGEVMAGLDVSSSAARSDASASRAVSPAPARGAYTMAVVARRLEEVYRETIAATSGREGRAGKTPVASHSLHVRGIGEEPTRRRLRHAAMGPSRPDWINADLHVHSNFSPDCVSPIESILGTAREIGLGALAIADHNEIEGAFLAQELAKGDPFIIVAEEVKTAEGEVIGLFLKEAVPRGLSFDRTLSLIKEQGGLVYVPHPFDAFRTTPSYRALVDNLHRIDVIEIYNAKVALSSFNLSAERFAAKYNIVAGAGSDAHVLKALGTAMLRMPRFNDPQSFMAALWEADIIARRKSLLYLQSLKLLQTTLDRVLPED